MPSIGIDSGSVAVKGVLMSGEKLLSALVESSGSDQAEQCGRMVQTLEKALPEGAEARVCATGYGRERVSGAEDSISEIFANALGTGWAWRNWEGILTADTGSGRNCSVPANRPARFRTIIDVGGQDSKVITFDKDGVIEGFAMNDRCAAGTGRFLEELALVLELEGPSELDILAMESGAYGRISSTCTVFAESEIVSMIAQGVSKADIAGGVFDAVADRVAELAESLRWSGPVLLDGGAARMSMLRRALEERLKADVAVPAFPQHITAVGAAIHAGGHLSADLHSVSQ